MRSPIKSKASGGRLNLFFLEMIIVLLFFSIASAVIMKTFVTADRVSRDSGRLERMSFCAQSAAEIFSDTGSISETAELLFGIKTEEATEISVPVNNKCIYNPTDFSGYMTMSIVGSEYEGRLLTLQITFTDEDGEVLYEIYSGSYRNEERTVL